MVTKDTRQVERMKKRRETDGERHGTRKDTKTAQHPNRARNRVADLWRLCISWPNTDNRGASSPISFAGVPFAVFSGVTVTVAVTDVWAILWCAHVELIVANDDLVYVTFFLFCLYLLYYERIMP